MDRTNSPINSILEQAAHIVRRKKETTGTIEQTESYKRGQTKELIDFDQNDIKYIASSSVLLTYKKNKSNTMIN